MSKKDIKKNNVQAIEAEEEIKAEEAAVEENTDVACENIDSSDAEKKTSTKSVVIRCVAAVLCTAILSYTVSNCVSSYAEASKPVEGSAVSDAGSFGDDFGTDTDDGSGNFADVPTGGDVDAPIEGDTSTDNTASQQGNEQTGGDSAANNATPAEDNKPVSAESMNTAQIVALFNNSANGAKTSAKSIKQNYTKNSQVTGIELKMKALASLADSLIKANMGEDPEKKNKTYTGADKAKFFPVSGQSWASKLSADDIKEATIKENNGTYNVVIKLKNDTQPNLKAGEGHAGKAISLVTKEQIVEGAGSAGMAVIKEESIKVTHSNCVIKATIDKATGHLKTANYYRVWKLELTALGIDVGISFGIEEDFVINW